MADDRSSGIAECIPKQGFIYEEDVPTSVVCKPKLMPLKSVTLEKLEKLQLDAEQKLRLQNDGFNAQNNNSIPSSFPFN